MNKKLKILHLEDLYSDVKLVDKILKKENLDFESLVVDSKDKFINALKEYSPDIILADHFLPSFNSYDALTLLQETGLKIPFILVTAHVSEEFAVDIIKQGADDYIFKDRPDRLPAAIHNALEKFSREKERDQMIHEQAHFAAIVNASNDGIISKTLDGIITSWNVSAEKLFGYSAAEAIGNNISIIIPSDRLKEELEFMESIKRGESVQHFETERLTKNGTRVDVSLTISPLNDKSGKVIGAAKIVYDITEKKKADEMLQRSEQIYREIAHEMQQESARLNEAQSVGKVGSWETDLQTFNVKWSEETHHIFETDPKTFHATHSAFLDFIHPEDRDKVNTAFENSFNSQTVNSIEHRIISTNGGVKHICENWKIFQDGEENPVRAVGTSQDITERKIAENKLNATSIELEKAVTDLNKILDSSLDVICTVNNNGEFETVSAASQQVWGYTPEELIGTQFINLVYHEDVDRTLNAAEIIVSGNQVPIFENRYVHKSGRVVPILWSVKWDEKNQLMFCIAKDVTEKKRLEKAVENERDQFFNMFSRAPAAIGMLKGADHVFEMANPLYLQLTGKKDVIGKTVAEVLPEVIEQGFIGMLDNVYRTGETYIGTETLVKVDKEGKGELIDFYMNFIYQAYRNDKGEIEGVFFFINDITEQQKAKENLLTISERLLLATTSAKMGIWDWDIVNDTTTWDNRMYELYGIGKQQFIGTYSVWQNRVHPDDIERVGKESSNAISGLHDYIAEFRVIWPDKSVHFIESHAIISRDEKGVAVRMIGGNIDITEKKRLEQAVENERDQFFDMFSKAPSAIGKLKGADHVFEMANPLYLQLTGKKDVIGKTVAEVLPEVIEQGFIAMLDNVYRTGETYIGTETLVKVDKEGNGKMTDFYMNFVYQAYRNVEGEIEGVFFFINDITEQILSRKKIEKSEKFFKGVIESSADMLTLIDPAGKTIYASPAVSKNFGYTNEECLEINIADIVHPDDALIMQDFVMKIMMHPGVPMEAPLIRLIKKDGSYIWIESTLTNFHETEGINAIISNFRDVTERKKAERELKDSNFRFEMISRATNDALWEWDFETGKLWANETHQQLYGLTLPDPVPTVDLWKERIHPEDRDAIVALQNRDLASDINIFISEYRFLDGNKEYRNIYDRCYIIRNKGGKAVGMVGSIVDVTELKKAEQSLAERERHLYTILQTEPDCIKLLGPKGELLDINPAGLAMLEADSMEQILNYSVEELITPQYRKDFARLTKEVFKGNSGKLEFEVIGLKGTHRLLETHAVPLKNAEGKIISLLGVTRDITERKKAEIENRFKANLLNTIGQAVIGTGMNGVVNYWNRAAENIYGWTKEEALGKNIIDLTPSEATYDQAIQIMEVLKKGQTWSGEFKVGKKDGTYFPALVTNSPIYDEHNKLSGIIGISTDITEQKKLEALLDKSNRLARIGSWEIDVVNNTVFWSDITKQIHGVPDDFIPDVETAIGLYKEGSSREAITKAINAALEKGTPFDLEVQIVTPANIDRWVRAIGEAEMVNGKFVRVYGSFQDIDERKKAEIEVLKAYEEKNIILESIGDAFFAVDKNSMFTYWNNKAEIIMTKNRDEVIGKNILDVFDDLLDTVTYKNYQAAITENVEQHYETFSEKLGKWLEVSAYPSNNGLTGYFRDITDRKLLNLQLSALNVKLTKNVNDLAISNRELEEFAYVASHDLQEPLRMVTGFLGQIEKKYSDVIDDKGKQYIHFAVDGAKRMRQIILDLLEFSKVGRIEDTEDFIDLNDIVREVILLCQNQIKETKAIVRFENMPSLVTYKTPLRQVFQNLLSNALKYHIKGETPAVNISAEETETHWQFAVSDNGIGIEEEYFDNIFVIFKRLHNKDEYSGTGIGLAVCKRIIENLGGKIWVESKEGKGSTFYFTMPKLLN